MKLKIFLVLAIFAFTQAHAQIKNVLGDGITIDHQVPDVEILNISGLTLNGVEKKTAHISDFKGKLLILDFWASWCSPCRAMIPVMDSLQKKFGDKVVFLPVTYEGPAKVDPVMAQMHKLYSFNLPDVILDKTLIPLFPHKYLPHYVWIDGQGIVRAITEMQDVNAKNIQAMLNVSTRHVQLPLKKDIAVDYDRTRPLFLGGNAGDGIDVSYHRVFSGYVEGLSGGEEITAWDSVKGQRFTVRNVPFSLLAKMAFRDSDFVFPTSRTRILSKDSAKMTSRLSGHAYLEWMRKGNAFSYELQLPPYMTKKPFAMIKEDLANLFPQWRISVETQVVKSLVLVRTSNVDKLKSAGGKSVTDVSPFYVHLHNAYLWALMIRLEGLYMQNSPLPIANGTGYKGPMDLDFEAPLKDVDAINAQLAKYDLAFVVKDYPAKLLIIRDAPVVVAK